eukprot:4505103-Ditylum_brightwellii.AAC.1
MDTNFIHNLLRRHPLAVKHSNKDRRLPLGLLIDAGGLWQDGVASLFEAYPAAIVKEDVDVKVFPHLLSKTWRRIPGKRSFDVVFQLLLAMPDLVPS